MQQIQFILNSLLNKAGSSPTCEHWVLLERKRGTKREIERGINIKERKREKEKPSETLKQGDEEGGR